MDILTPIVTGAMLTVFTVVLTLLGKAQFDVLRAEMDVVRSDLATFRSEVRADIAELRSELAVMRSDLTHVALAVGARPRPQTG